jgi:hypothetical protein
MDEMLDRVETISNALPNVADRKAIQKEFLEEMASASAVTLAKALDFLRFLTYEERELEQDLADARAAIAEGKQEGTISLADLKQGLGLSGMYQVEILPAARRQIKKRQTGVKSRNVLDRVMNTRQELLSTIEQLSEEQLTSLLDLARSLTQTGSLLDRRTFLRLPAEERDRVLAEQAEFVAAEFQPESEGMEWVEQYVEDENWDNEQ